MAWAEHTFRLGRVQHDGATEGQHRANAARQWAALGKVQNAQAASVAPSPAFPDRLGYLWRWFCAIDAGLPQDGWAQPVVSWQALAAWCEVTRTELEPWEAEALVQIGHIRAGIFAERLDGHSHDDRPVRR